MKGLPDYLAHGLKILFVGYNPGERSAVLGHHFAGRGNLFWRLLYEAGLTPRLYDPTEDGMLKELGYGLTNLVPRPSKSSSDLSTAEMREGALELRIKVTRYKPAIVCFLGKEVYRRFAGISAKSGLSYGPVEGADVTQGVLAFVAPNPSGRSTILYADKLAVFIQLQTMVKAQKLRKDKSKALG